MTGTLHLYSDRRIGERVDAYEQRQALFAKTEHPVTGIATGLAPLDHVTMGIQQRDLWVVQGRTGVGKTYLMCFVANQVRRQGHRVLFVNREMDPVHVMGRIDALAAHFSFHRWRQGKLTPEELGRYRQLRKATAALNPAKARIDVVPPIPRLTPEILRHIIKQYKPTLVLVDYVNRMDADNDGTEGYTNNRKVADALKDLAYRDGIPVLAAAQTNRQSTFIRGRAIPGTEHIYGGDALGWNADLVMSMYCNTEMLVKGHMGLLMVKYRHGEELDMILNWNLHLGKISVESVGNRHLIDVEKDAEDPDPL